MKSRDGSTASGMRSMPLRLRTQSPRFAAKFAAFATAKREAAADVDAVVLEILDEVKRRGDAAVIDYTKRFDRLDLAAASMRIAPAEIAEAARACDGETLAALRFAAERIEAYHRRQIPEDFSYEDAAGVRLGARWRPLAAVGLYVPGGTAAYPSSVLMNAIPAKVAGVERLVMVVPSPDGVLNPLVLAAAALVGLDEVYRIGGAQGVAALAYGTETIAAVDKIAGPGNAYVAAAKRHVFGTVGIDTIAGPSEILVIADGANNPDWIAADLLSQAEHDASSQCILITDDAQFADRVAEAIEKQTALLPRKEIAAKSWDGFGAIIVVQTLDDAAPLADAIAAEHLEIATADPEALL